jgi:hypothetical protein
MVGHIERPITDRAGNPRGADLFLVIRDDVSIVVGFTLRQEGAEGV